MTRLYSLYKERIRLITFIYLCLSSLILVKMFYIQTFEAKNLRNSTLAAGKAERTVKGFRGHIYANNGEVLAETIKTYTFWANTLEKVDKDKIVNLFASVFNSDEQYYINLLSKNKKYIMLAHGKLESQCKPILDQIKNINGLYLDINTSRYYPYRNLVSQVVGYLDRDYNGQFGIEEQFDPLLKGKASSIIFNRSANGRLKQATTNQNPDAKDGSDIYLTIDIKTQIILLDALKKGLIRSGAKSANGVILNPFSGDILAMASIPDYDPNEYPKYDPITYLNKTISDAYEPGSTFKIIPLTAALELNAFNQLDSFYCEKGKYEIIPTRFIHDHEPHENLTLSEIFIYSSNIGLSKMVDQLGARHIYDYSRKYGFGIRTGIPLPSETPGILREYRNWTRVSGASVSMGQEISINTLQLGLAYSAVANGGYLPKARLIKHITGEEYEKRDYSPQPIRQIMSEKTSKIILDLMEDVINKGTATKARIPGFKIGGKTGTAQKSINGKYSKHEFISSFAAVFPLDDPKYVCIVSVDSPDYQRSKHWGNETAAPIVKDIFERLIMQSDEFIPVNNIEMVQYTNKIGSKNANSLLNDENTITYQNTIPDFRGLTLKQSIKKAKNVGISVNPLGTSGRVVWQSVAPGKLVENTFECTIKLEPM